MKRPYFQPKPSHGTPYVPRNSYKAAPLWAKVMTFGTIGLVAVMFLLYAIPMKSKNYNEQLRQKTDKIHQQIIEGKFHDIFIEGDRDLIKFNDEVVFTQKLAAGQTYLSGKYEKWGGDQVHFEDVYNRAKEFFGSPAQVVSGYSLKNDAGNANESFYWTIRNGELKLAGYEFYMQHKNQ